MGLRTYLTEEVPSSHIQMDWDSKAKEHYQKMIDYLRAVGEIVSSPNTADSKEEVYVFDLLPSPLEQIVVVRRYKTKDYNVVDVRVIGENSSAIAKNLVMLVRGD